MCETAATSKHEQEQHQLLNRLNCVANMIPAKRQHPRIVDSSDEDEPAIVASSDTEQQFRGLPHVHLPTPQEHQNLQDLPEMSSDAGSSDSDDPVSRKARKLAMIMRQQQQHQPQVPTTAAAVNPFVYAMLHGKFPKTQPTPMSPMQQVPEPPMLTDPGYLWNAVPPKTCQYLDLEAAHAGSETSEGSTGSSDGSLDDPDFIDKVQDSHTAEDRSLLEKLFPKTFGPKTHSVPSRIVFPGTRKAPPVSSDDGDRADDDEDRPSGNHSPAYENRLSRKNHVMVNGIIQFPIWKRAPVLSHPVKHHEFEVVD